MIKSAVVKSDSEKLSLYITDYANKFEALQADWEGISYDKLKEKANSFVAKAKTVITMMNCLAEVCEKYEKYVEGLPSAKAKATKKIISEVEAIEKNLYSIQDLENVTIGNTNFVTTKFSTNLLNEVPVYSNKRGVFKLNSDITSGAFRTIRNNLDQLITTVSAYDVSMEDTPDFTVKIDQMVKKVVKNLEICANRVQNTIIAIEAVVNNHKRLQYNLVEYVTREEPTKTEENKKTNTTASTTEKQTEKKKEETTKQKEEATKEEEEEPKVVEAQLPETQAGGYGGGYGSGQAETPAETQPEIEVPTSTVPAATTPRVIKAQTKDNSSDATAIIPLAGIGLVGAAGGVALLAKKKREEEEEEEYLEDEEIEETDFNNNKKQQRSSKENKEWLHSLGLGISDDVDSSTIENDSISIGANN